MTINEHKTEFAGRPIINWEPGDPIQDPTGVNYRIAALYDMDGANATWLSNVKHLWKKPPPKPDPKWQSRFDSADFVFLQSAAHTVNRFISISAKHAEF